LKFLKTRATEVGHVTDWLTRLGLANPALGVTMAEEGRTLLRADPTDDFRERIAALLGRDLFKALYPVDGSSGDVKVTGFAAGPQRANNNSREIYTYVNGRYVRDRNLLHAVSRAYDGVLPIGRQPACVLFLHVPPDKVDVNVHPQKLEVRFVEQRSVYDAVAKGLSYTLSSSPWLTTGSAPAKSYALRPVEDALPAVETAPLLPHQQRIAEALERYSERNPNRTTEALFARPSDRYEAPLQAADSFRAPPEPLSLPPPPMIPLAPVPMWETRPIVGEARISFSELRYLGQVHRTYLVCEAPEGLVLLDQHAGHERVLYERFRKERAGCATKGQPFLVPITMELSPADARLVEAAIEDLADLGFEIEPFGGLTFSLKAAPAELMGSDLPRMVRELAAEVRSLGRGTVADSLEEGLLARMACHGAVRAGHSLSQAEAEELLRSLEGTPFNAQCPHGRPVIVQFDVDALKEMFGRTYEGTPRASARERIER
jgi:DNA mismatch repair protein MutL